MSDGMNSGGLIVIILGMIVGSGAFGAFVTKVMPQRVSREDRFSKLDERVRAVERDLGDERDSRRRLEDYVEDLRVHISEGKGPPPPDWPEGLR